MIKEDWELSGNSLAGTDKPSKHNHYNKELDRTFCIESIGERTIEQFNQGDFETFCNSLTFTSIQTCREILKHLFVDKATKLNSLQYLPKLTDFLVQNISEHWPLLMNLIGLVDIKNINKLGRLTDSLWRQIICTRIELGMESYFCFMRFTYNWEDLTEWTPMPDDFDIIFQTPDSKQRKKMN